MQKNSLVQCINDHFLDGGAFNHIKKPVKNYIYVVRDIGEHLTVKKTKAVLLEEIVNEVEKNGYEPAFDARRFIEIQKPTDVTSFINNILNSKK